MKYKVIVVCSNVYLYNKFITKLLDASLLFCLVIQQVHCRIGADILLLYALV